ncbi:MAG: Rpn family recombination-promoting nuclease/putative transposase [Prevotellaceae bacterium]|jgi:predicted transposase/invertase (TIGR01784 family)|nr:Rpn family recombination-promoting nuclease/putative transposase [Prevotellaceae bacterium]
MGRYLDPKNDIPFKRVFGEHPNLLKSFLNALLPFENGQHIVNLNYLPAELVPENAKIKDSIVDVRCTDNYGRQFIVEMQMYWSKSFSKRMVFNASKAYIKQLASGVEYNFLQSVYFLGIINEIFDKKTSEYYHHFKSINCKNSDEVIEEGQEYVMIELPKFTPKSITEKRMAVLWLRFLREIKEYEYIEPAVELMENKYIRQAIELCEEGAYNENEKLAYERYWDTIRKEKTALADSRAEGKAEGIEIGRAEGIETGRAEGIETGRAEGIETGRAEGIETGEKRGKAEEKENTVIKSFKNGVSLDIISSITDLSNDEINTILKKYKLI